LYLPNLSLAGEVEKGNPSVFLLCKNPPPLDRRGWGWRYRKDPYKLKFVGEMMILFLTVDKILINLIKISKNSKEFAKNARINLIIRIKL